MLYSNFSTFTGDSTTCQYFEINHKEDALPLPKASNVGNVMLGVMCTYILEGVYNLYPLYPVLWRACEIHT